MRFLMARMYVGSGLVALVTLAAPVEAQRTVASLNLGWCVTHRNRGGNLTSTTRLHPLPLTRRAPAARRKFQEDGHAGGGKAQDCKDIDKT